jgi:hypothetical protein
MAAFPLYVSKYNDKPQRFELFAIRKSDLRGEQASLHPGDGSIDCEQLLT